MFGVDRGLPLSELSTYLKCIVGSKRNVSLWYDYMNNVNASVFTTIKDVAPPDMVRTAHIDYENTRGMFLVGF